MTFVKKKSHKAKTLQIEVEGIVISSPSGSVLISSKLFMTKILSIFENLACTITFSSHTWIHKMGSVKLAFSQKVFYFGRVLKKTCLVTILNFFYYRLKSSG